MSLSKLRALSIALVSTIAAPALATAPGHEHAVEEVDEAALLAVKNAYRARRGDRSIRVRLDRQGALSGKRIGVSAGHGIIWNPDAGDWLFQRATEAYSWGGIREDIHTNQLVIDYLVPMIERAGGAAITMRERSYIETSTLIDNDGAEGGTYTETGTWESGASEGYGGTYRFAYLDPQGQATATWSFTVPDDGVYPVYAYFLASDNRTAEASYLVTHATGSDLVDLDQSQLRPEDWALATYPNVPPGSEATVRYNDLWHHLGNFPFRAGDIYEVKLSATGDDPEKVVIADALHVGGGRDAAPAPNGSYSGRARWEEGAMPYLEWLGAPSWMFVGDVSIRPLYSVYQGVDAYLAVHTNCCEARGTSTWVWYPEMYVRPSAWAAGHATNNLPPGTLDLAESVHADVVARAREGWKSDWRDGGIVGANFGELRAIRNAWYEDVNTYGASDPVTIPAMLIEFAYHDTEPDSVYIREEGFRHDVARGLFTGLTHSIVGAGAVISPLPPATLHAHVVDRALEVAWEPQPDPLEPSATADRYHVYTSNDGLLFTREPIVVEGTSTTLPLNGCEPLYVKVTAVNEGGESLDSPVVGGRLGSTDGPRILYVDGVDREVRTEEDPSNDRNWARVYLPAILASQAGATIDATTDDDVARIAAADTYDLVVWSTGQTSTRVQSLTDTDRATLTTMLGAGTKVILSGAELIWEHIEVGNETTAAFARDALGVDYVSDDANTTMIDAAPLGLGELAFGDCSADAPCMHYPDVIAEVQGGTGLATYPAGGAAIVQSQQGVTFAGFPLETAAPPARREELIATLVTRGLDGVPAGSGECPAPATDPDAGDNSTSDAGPTDPDAANSGGSTDGGPRANAGADAGPGADAPDRIAGTGCSCGTTRRGPDAGVLFLALLMTLMRRRRRAT